MTTTSTHGVAGRFFRRHGPAAALLAIHFSLAVSSATTKSPTFDEIAHIGIGLSCWITGDYRLYTGNGLLPQAWATLPVAISGDVRRHPAPNHPAWLMSSYFDYGDQIMYQAGNDASAILFHARAAVALLSVLTGMVVYVWSCRLFGLGGGLISLTLYTFSPDTLAHGRLVTTDLTTALAMTLAVAAVWSLIHTVTWRSLSLAALAIAAVLLSKFSGFLIVPMAAAMLAVALIFGRRVPLTLRLGKPAAVDSLVRRLAIYAGAFVAVTLLVVALLWMTFGFRYQAFHHVEAHGGDRYAKREWSDMPTQDGVAGVFQSTVWFARDHRLLPEAFLRGMMWQKIGTTRRRAFLNGERSEEGWWYFFVVSTLIKTPLPYLIAFVLTLYVVLRCVRRRPRDDHASDEKAERTSWYDLSPLVVLIGVYLATAVAAKINIGHRHLLPVFPAVFVLCGALAIGWRRGRRWWRGVVAVLLVWGAVEATLAWPHYLAYFNQLIGGPRHAYRHLVDSSLDWGQDLSGLARWLNEHAPRHQPDTPVYLSYFGSVRPERLGISAYMLPCFFDHRAADRDVLPLRGGVYCISATMLQSIYTPPVGPWSDEHEQLYQQVRRICEPMLASHAAPVPVTQVLAQRHGEQRLAGLRMLEQLQFARLCHYLRRRTPDDMVGYSILIYRLNDKDLVEALTGPYSSPERAKPVED